MGNIQIVWVAWPGHIGFAVNQRLPDGMNARYKVAILSQLVEYGCTDPGHDVHIGHNVRRIGYLNANMCDRRTNGAHAERDNIHRAAAHTTVKQAI